MGGLPGGIDPRDVLGYDMAPAGGGYGQPTFGWEEDAKDDGHGMGGGGMSGGGGGYDDMGMGVGGGGPGSSPMSRSVKSNRSFKSPERMNDPSKNFKVVIRVRPPLPRELEADKPFQNVVAVTKDERQIAISENLSATEDGGQNAQAGPYTSHRFTFDHVYDANENHIYIYIYYSVISLEYLGS